MAPDFDLSNLQTAQVDLWICLQADAICGQILADQAQRLGFAFALRGGIVSTVSREAPAIFSNGLRGAGV